MELGANCPLIVAADADLEQAADATAVGGYSNAGQACISAQRILVDARGLRRLPRRARRSRRPDRGRRSDDARGDDGPARSAPPRPSASPRSSRRRPSPAGASSTAASATDALHAPTIVADVPTRSAGCSARSSSARRSASPPSQDSTRRSRSPTAASTASAPGIFTRDVHAALRFAREIEAGVVQINWSPLWRADSMPYGGSEAQRNRQGGPALGRRGADRPQDRRLPSTALGVSMTVSTTPSTADIDTAPPTGSRRLTTRAGARRLPLRPIQRARRRAAGG